MSDLTTLSQYADVLRRRANWLVIIVVGVVAAALVYTLHESPEYQATATALINREQMDLASELSGQPSNLVDVNDQGRLAFTQVGIAESPTVAAHTIQALGLTHVTPRALLSDVSVTGSATTDLLEFAATNHTRSRAVALVNAYVEQYVLYTEQLDTQSIKQALVAIAKLQASGSTPSLSTALTSRDQQLQILEALQTGDIEVVGRADLATQIQPKPIESIAIGLLLGLILGAAAAFLVETFDTRVRTSDEAVALLGVPRLTEIPKFSRALAASGSIPTLDSGSQVAESFRILRTSLEFIDVDRDVSCILVTSSIAGEGKSMVASNLAVSLARSGRTVAIADLDLRRPRVASIFQFARTRRGVTDVATGRVALADAVTDLRVVADQLVAADGDSSSSAGRLLVLPAGPVPPDPGEFVRSQAVARLIAELREQVDVLILDTPPLLPVSDPISVSALADGIVVVVRPELLRRPMLRESARTLALSGARVLGVVVNCSAGRKAYAYYQDDYDQDLAVADFSGHDSAGST
jgi:receptor protein-tyrosine kinase